MADQKITALTENTAPVLTDILPMVDDPAGTPATQKISLSTLADLFTNNSIYRQAIINGNFDVWQRGTTVTPPDVSTMFLADRWADTISKDGGTLPTLSRTRQTLTAGELSNSYYFTRLNTNGAGTSLGVNSYHRILQKIENGTRFLCGANKTVTVSFWARSDISNKRITPALIQNYGTGGSPTAQEAIKGEPITLTSTLTKYTATFTTNTLTGKTFGTANDDFLELDFWYMWGTTIGNSYVKTSVTAETYVGSGNIDIAQVQLCAGSVALPFMPKSFDDELRACQRFFQMSNPYGVTPGTNQQLGSVAHFYSDNNNSKLVSANAFFRVSMRASPTVVVYDHQGTINKITTTNAVGVQTGNVAPAGIDMISTESFRVYYSGTVAGLQYEWTAEKEL